MNNNQRRQVTDGTQWMDLLARPDVWLAAGRLFSVVALFIALTQPMLPALALQLQHWIAVQSNTATPADPLSVYAAERLSVFLDWLMLPQIRLALMGLALITLLLLLVDLLRYGWRLVQHRHAALLMVCSVLRVRVLGDQQRSRRVSADAGSLWRSVINTARSMRQQGVGPAHVAMTLTSRPDEPVTAGVVIGAGSRKDVTLARPAGRPTTRFRATSPGQQGRLGRRPLDPIYPLEAPDEEAQDSGSGVRNVARRSLEVLLQSLDADCVVDEATEQIDQLKHSLADNPTVYWCEFGLARTTLLPFSSAEQSDALLSTLINALELPDAIRWAELQLCLSAGTDDGHIAGWREVALRRCDRLAGSNNRRAADERAALEQKIGDELGEATLRLTMVVSPKTPVTVVQNYVRRFMQALEVGNVRFSGGVQRIVPQGLPRLRRRSLEIGLDDRILSLLLPIRASLIVFAAFFSMAFLSIDEPLAAAVLAGVAGGLWIWLSHLPDVYNGTFYSVLARMPRTDAPQRLLLPFGIWRGAMLLGPAELVRLWRLPEPGAGLRVERLPNRYIPAHADVVIPTGATDRLLLGYAVGHRTATPIGPTLNSLRQIMHLTAGVGAGKSRALANMAHQLIPNGFLLLDGKGDDRGALAATVRSYIELRDLHRVAYLDIRDEWPIGLNPIAGIDPQMPGGMTRALGTVLGIFARLDPEVWRGSQGMQQFALMGAALLVEAEPEPTLTALKRVLQDESYRSALLMRCSNVEVSAFWQERVPKMKDGMKTSLDALIRRLDNILVDPTTRFLFSLPQPTLDFSQIIDEGDILIMPVPHRTLGGLAEVIAMLVLMMIVRAAFQRGGNDQSRATVPLIVDELQVFVGPEGSRDFRDAISQLRALGIGGIYAHQSLSQLGNLREEMMQNAANRIILRTDPPDANVYAQHYPASGLTAADISNQEASQHQYGAFLTAEGRPELVSYRPLPWPQLPDHDRMLSQMNPAPGDWRSQLPAGPAPAALGFFPNVCANLDTELLRLVYELNRDDAEYSNYIARLARLSDAQWHSVLGRWSQIRDHQRAYLLRYPRSAASWEDLLLWVTQRLRVAMPPILAAAAFQRQRWMSNPDEPLIPPPPSPTHPSPMAMIPGLAPGNGESPAPPRFDSLQSTEEIMRQRGRRRAHDDLAEGFDDLREDG